MATMGDLGMGAVAVGGLCADLGGAAIGLTRCGHDNRRRFWLIGARIWVRVFVWFYDVDLCLDLCGL